MGKTITQTTTDSDSITLKKATKGYTWETKLYGAEHEELLKKIEKIDAKLKEKYGSEE